MCGRYSLAIPEPDVLRARFGLGPRVQLHQRYNIAPGQLALNLVSEGDGVRAEQFQWGLVPSWADSPAIGSHLINARGETVAEKPAFRSSFRKRRCLVIADGFFEWRPARHGAPKQPYRFTLADGAPFCFAGIWSEWEAAPGDPLRTFAIITTEANADVRGIHDRMPVVLAEPDEAAWLATETPPQKLQELLLPTPDGTLISYPVPRAVNSPRNDDPSVVKRVEQPGEPEHLF